MLPLADTSLTVALISAVAAIFAAGGSVTAAVVSWRLGRSRFEHEREQADRADGREVLAAGALALGRVKATRRKVHAEFRDPLADLSIRWPDDFGTQMDSLLVAYEGLEDAVASLRIRFAADDPVVTEASSALEDTEALYTLYWDGHGSAFNQNQVRDAAEDAKDGSELIRSYDAHEDAYLAAAQTAVGVKL